MFTTEDPSLLLDALSDRVLRNLSTSTWRKLFLRPHEEVIRFEAMHGTLLCASLQVPSWGAGARVMAELAVLATGHGGALDPCPSSTALVRFDEPRAAFQMALDMQQLAGDVRFQVGLVSGSFSVATLMLEGGLLRVAVGREVERAAAVARLASPGSIRIAPETYREVQDLAEHANCLLTTEYEEQYMTAASLALAPRPKAQQRVIGYH